MPVNSPDSTPLALFRQLENDSLGDQLVDQDVRPGEFWRGFVFKVDELDLVLPLFRGFEIVPCQELSPLPMVKSWVKGMTNIRGEIYTVVDFSEFIGKKPVRATKNCNLFLLPDVRMKSALLIESRVGLQSFSSELRVCATDSLHPGLTPYLGTVLVDEGLNRGVIDIRALCDADRFVHIGR